MHALVLLTPSASPTAGLDAEHERFIDELDRGNTIVLGGSWKPAAGGFDAAYLLSCDSLDEARAVAASDPFVRSNAVRCEVVEWELVGVNPEAIDRASLLYPDWH
jgi:uncharacterized protein YciI